jgi:hypothetical protein
MNDNPRRRQNVTRQMATNAALANKGVYRVFIWYDNQRDGWHWDYEGSEWLGYRENNQPKTDKLIEVH